MTTRKGRRAAEVEPRSGTNYPDEFRARIKGRAKRALGDLFGLDQFGVNLTELAPGAHSALRHWHSHEDELVYVLEGEITLVLDTQEVTVSAGEFVINRGTNHAWSNRSTRPAVVAIASHDAK